MTPTNVKTVWDLVTFERKVYDVLPASCQLLVNRSDIECNAKDKHGILYIVTVQ